ncbi:protein TolR [Bacterioplanes sanyensis]|uniref:Tol-Pal system protein TolR n=1 Tax=Bacterioplanes sanyensis TaxID=1249553 RepID=A0A222FL21_9GAMM|nr:protein TolR [Bacterioplanes sanyensis]ASP39459.1 protein TolR [Bacterioplanes sanyensis]
MEPMSGYAAKRRPMAEINVVPYIDVMLVLLIIFMVTAPMLVQTVPVDLPDVDAKPTEIDPDDHTLIIAVNQQGQLFIEREEDEPQAMTLDQVQDYAAKVVAQTPATRIMVRGDQQVAYGRVVALMGALQAADINNIGLVTEAPDPQAK